MSLRTPDDLAQYIWDTLETDDQELPQSLLSTWFADGYDRIQNYVPNWRHLQCSWEFDTVGSQRQYPLADMSEDFVVRNIRSIVDNELVGWKLRPVAHDDALSIWSGPSITNATPMFFSTWEDELNLWPVPADAHTLTCTGYREAKEFGEDGDDQNIDLPRDLCMCVALWGFKRFYDQQEDPEMAQAFEAEFWGRLQRSADRENQPDMNQPVIVNGGRFHKTWSRNDWLARSAVWPS